MDFTGERVVPWAMPTGKAHVVREHVVRYAWASGYVANKRVVDLGCGCGYGSFLLSWSAAHVLGLDCDMQTILWANGHFDRPNCRFYQADIEQHHIPPADVYVALECLEHLRDPAALVKRLKGTLLWSLPVNRVGKFHKHDYSLQEALNLMAGSEFWYQKGASIVPQAHAWFGPDNVLGLHEYEG